MLLYLSPPEKRMKLIDEFMSSELIHVEALKTLVVEYLQPLRTQLPKETVKKLFGNIEVIMGWNMQFYGRLRTRYEESEDLSMDSNAGDHEFLFGDIMVEMVRRNSVTTIVQLYGVSQHRLVLNKFGPTLPIFTSDFDLCPSAYV
jgi:hypothetical protein